MPVVATAVVVTTTKQMVAMKQPRYTGEAKKKNAKRREKRRGEREREKARFVARVNRLSETANALDVSLEWRGRDDYNCVQRGSIGMKNEVARSPAHRVGESETHDEIDRETERLKGDLLQTEEQDETRRRKGERERERRKKVSARAYTLARCDRLETRSIERRKWQ